MRVSRFTQFSLVAIATGSAVLLGFVGGAAMRDAGMALTSLETISQAQDDSDRGTAERPLRRRPGELLRSLNLSRSQKQQLFDIQNQYRSDIQDHRQRLRSDITKLRELMTSDVPAAEVSEQFMQVQNRRQALNEVKFNGYLAIREVLTLEQRQIFSEQLQTRRQSRGRRRRLNRAR